MESWGLPLLNDGLKRGYDIFFFHKSQKPDKHRIMRSPYLMAI